MAGTLGGLTDGGDQAQHDNGIQRGPRRWPSRQVNRPDLTTLPAGLARHQAFPEIPPQAAAYG
ncbi:hypothetical protein [Micromonospora noduli]|uniref:hypothetical protein n=1 Tax=Micromonospora noduli TaxID=709876 RepID=UPI0015EC363A|nr:hypothetical protein [Micromonospora noduli]